MGSFPTRPFQEGKPQNGDPDKFSSTEHKFNSFGSQNASINNSAINEKKSWQRYVMDILEAKEEILMAK